MKKYSICLLLFVVVSLACLMTGYVITRGNVKQENAISDAAYETETVTENQVVINQKQVEPVVEKYYLVSETGYLLVFSEDQSTICLYTNIPLTEFPEDEQEHLRAGIWFSSMMEVYNYLESYTS